MFEKNKFSNQTCHDRLYQKQECNLFANEPNTRLTRLT